MWHRRDLRRACCKGAVQQFVKFAAVKPDTPACRAIVDLNTLALGHDQGRVGASGAFHDDSFEFGQAKHVIELFVDFLASFVSAGPPEISVDASSVLAQGG
jgi:hypothetical protein